nr:ribosomal protein S4 [Pteridophyllum racemosum]
MSRYRGPRFKKIRRLGNLPGLSSKRLVKPEKEKSNKKRIEYLSHLPEKQKKIEEKQNKKETKQQQKNQYLIRLKEKQKLRFHYGLTERQLVKYVRIAGKVKGPTGQVLLQLLEMRLDNILFRLGMASTIPGARQLVNHRHIFVNGHIVDIPSYRCKPQDIITTRDEQKSRAMIQNFLDLSTHKKLPKHLIFHPSQYKGLVNQIIDRNCVGLEIEELRVVEYYSRQI